MVKLTFATINTWKCDGAYEKRLQWLASQLSDYSIDLLCCQEVFSANNFTANTEKYLKNVLGLKSFYFPSRKKERLINNNSVLSFSGLCAFTNLIIQEEKKIYLPTDINDGERTAQILSFKKEGKHIAVINTHLTHLKKASLLRCFQVHEILKNINFNEYELVFICGDFNDTPNSKVIKLLEEEYSFTSVLKKHYPTAGNRCIDYIFYKSNIKLHVLDAKIILNKASNEGMLPSDHFGILTTFNF